MAIAICTLFVRFFAALLLLSVAAHGLAVKDNHSSAPVGTEETLDSFKIQADGWHYHSDTSHQHMNEFGGQVGGMDYHNDAIHKHVEAIEGQAAASHLQIDALHKHVEELEGQVAASHVQIGALHEHVKELEGQVASSNFQLDANHKYVRDLENEVATSHFQIDASHKHVEELEGQVAASHFQIDAFRKHVQELEGQVAASHVQIGALHEHVKELESQAAAKQYQNEALRRRVRDLEGQVTASRCKIDAIYNDVKKLKCQVHDEIQALERASAAAVLRAAAVEDVHEARAVRDAVREGALSAIIEAKASEKVAIDAAGRAHAAMDDREKAEAYWKGSDAQLIHDMKVVQDLSHSLREDEAKLPALEALEDRARDAATSTGEALGELAADYKPNTKVGWKIAQSLLGAKLQGEALRAQEASANAAGVDVATVPQPYLE